MTRVPCRGGKGRGVGKKPRGRRRKEEKKGERGRRRARARPVATPIYFVLQLFRSNPANLLKCRPARPRPSARYLFLSFSSDSLSSLPRSPPLDQFRFREKLFSSLRSARPRATVLKDTIAVYSFHPRGIIPLIKGNESRIDSPSERWLYNSGTKLVLGWFRVSFYPDRWWRWFCIDGIYCIDVYYFQQLVKFHCIACVTILG